MNQEQEKQIRNLSKEQAIEICALMQQMLRFSDITVNRGLLMLLDQLDSVKEPLVKKGFDLAIDGTDPDELKRILAHDVQTLNPGSFERLKGVLIASSVLKIQAAAGPAELREFFFKAIGQHHPEIFEHHVGVIARREDGSLAAMPSQADIDGLLTVIK